MDQLKPYREFYDMNRKPNIYIQIHVTNTSFFRSHNVKKNCSSNLLNNLIISNNRVLKK
jgi:hypothetical protein